MIIIVSLVFSLVQFTFLRAYATTNFPFKDIIAGIQNFSPEDNKTYTGDVPLDIHIRFSVRSPKSNSGLIPYQDINCIYQLDDGEWRNASLYYASEQETWGDPTGGYWNQIYCNYSAVLKGLSNGVHSLNVTITPDLKYHYRVLSDGSSLHYSVGHYVYDALTNSTINFYVFGNYDEPIPTDQPAISPEITFSVVITSVIITIITVIVLRRKNSQAN